MFCFISLYYNEYNVRYYCKHPKIIIINLCLSYLVKLLTFFFYCERQHKNTYT